MILLTGACFAFPWTLKRCSIRINAILQIPVVAKLFVFDVTINWNREKMLVEPDNQILRKNLCMDTNYQPMTSYLI